MRPNMVEIKTLLTCITVLANVLRYSQYATTVSIIKSMNSKLIHNGFVRPY